MLNVTVLTCSSSGGTFETNIFSVSADESGKVYVAVAEPYQTFLSLNASAIQRLQYPVNASAPLSCSAPSVPLLRSFASPTCANASLLSYPSSGGVFLNGDAASFSSSLWLGLWIAFLCVFLICVPILVVVACMIWRED